MRITQKKINALVRQSLKENVEMQIKMRELAKQDLIDRIRSFESYKNLRDVEREISVLKPEYRDLAVDSYSDVILRAVKEENLAALGQLGGTRLFSSREPFSSAPPDTPTHELQRRFRAKYNVAPGEVFVIEHGMERDFYKRHFDTLFTTLERRAAFQLEKFLKKHPYIEPPPRGFLQKAGSFLTGKGFRE